MQVGRYRVVRTIGHGGMAEVFEAVALGEGGFQRRVALKRILPGHETDPSFLRMFLDEARIASSLHHSNVVAVLDFGVVDGRPFQVLELVEGTDLRTLLRIGVQSDAPLPVELALHVCTEVAHALDHAHHAADPQGRPLGIVHRDVSPTNILVSWSGEVKLTDFGIAFARDRREETRTGVTKGKLLYSAPEQVLRGEIDARTDVFGLGCVLHELVAGVSPLAGDDRMRDLLLGGTLDLGRGLPDDVQEIVARALRGERSERWPSAAAMAEATGQALARRLRRDAKTAMREWLERVRPQTPSPSPRGLFDELLDADLVLGDATAGVRRFESLRTAPTRLDRPGPRAADPAVPAASVRRKRGWTAVAVVGAALVGATAVAGTAAWQLAARSDSAGADPVHTAAPIPAPGTGMPAVLAPGTASPPASPVPHEATDGEAVPENRRGRRRPAEARRRATVGAGEVLADGSDADSGFLVIGGEGAHRAEILVDGRSRGYAPKRIELALGEHAVVLVTPDGRRLGPRRILVTARNTGSAPVRWSVAAGP